MNKEALNYAMKKQALFGWALAIATVALLGVAAREAIYEVERLEHAREWREAERDPSILAENRLHKSWKE